MAHPLFKSFSLSQFPVWLFNWLLFLAALAAISTSLYLGVLAIPIITLAMAGILMPQGVITFIALIPIIVTVLLALRFVRLNWEVRKAEIVDYLGKTLEKGFWLDLPKDSVGAEIEDWKGFHKLVVLGTLVLGGYLALKLVPFLMGLVSALGIPFSVSVVFSAAASAALMIITYQLLGAIITLKNLWDARKNLSLFNIAMAFGAVLGIAVAAAATYLAFPVLVQALAPVLSLGLATFAAIAVSFSLALLLMRLVPVMGSFFIKGTSKTEDKLVIDSTGNNSQSSASLLSQVPTHVSVYIHSPEGVLESRADCQLSKNPQGLGYNPINLLRLPVQPVVLNKSVVNNSPGTESSALPYAQTN